MGSELFGVYPQKERRIKDLSGNLMSPRRRATDGGMQPPEFDRQGFYSPIPKLTAEEKGEIRKFDSGATRSGDKNKYDPEGFISPLVIERFCEFMHMHRHQKDGQLRDSDNWQRGIPIVSYIKSLIRHVKDVWLIHRGFFPVDRDTGKTVVEEDALCAIIFNASGMLHEKLKQRNYLKPVSYASQTTTKV